MAMAIINTARRHWRAGAQYGFHRCCRARFIASNARPRLFERIVPGWAHRLRRFRPRHVLADGCVPCEIHALRWLLDGRKDHWRAPLPPGVCCQVSRGLAAGGHATLAREDVDAVDPDDLEHGECATASGQVFRVWFLGLGEERISVNFCPWCGTSLAGLEA